MARMTVKRMSAGWLAPVVVVFGCLGGGCQPLQAECWVQIATTGGLAIDWDEHTAYTCSSSDISSSFDFTWELGQDSVRIDANNVGVGQTGAVKGNLTIEHNGGFWDAVPPAQCSVRFDDDALVAGSSEYYQVKGQVTCSGGLTEDLTTYAQVGTVTFAHFYSTRTPGVF